MKTPRLSILLGSLLLCCPTPAQENLLVIERKTDRAGRNLLLQKLKRVRVTLNFVDASAEEVAQYLSTAAGESIAFIVSSRTVKPSELPKLDLTLKKISLHNAMAVIQAKTDLRFVYRSGVVFIRPKDEVKEFTYLEFYDVRAAVMKAPNFPAPKLGLPVPGEEGGNFEEEDESDATTSGFDADKLVDMIRTHVLPDSWDSGQGSITVMQGVLAVRHTESGHRKVRDLLVKFGAIPRVRYRVLRPGVRPFVRFGRRGPKPVRPGDKAVGKPPAAKPAKKPAAKPAKKPAKKPPVEKPPARDPGTNVPG